MSVYAKKNVLSDINKLCYLGEFNLFIHGE